MSIELCTICNRLVDIDQEDNGDTCICARCQEARPDAVYAAADMRHEN